MLKRSLYLLPALFLAAAVSSAQAELHRPEAYKKLTAVELAPGQAPRTLNGLQQLSRREKSHQEKLPLQLDGAVKKIKKSRYAPQGVSRDLPSGF